MLKLTYTENGFSLEYITQSLEEWVKNRVLLALRSGVSLCLEPSSASFLLPVTIPNLVDLGQLIKAFNRDVVALVPCGDDSVEICLEGTWLAASMDSNTGLFVRQINEVIEKFLVETWQETQQTTSVIND